MISVRDKISHVLTEQAWVRGVGIDFLLQSCCCQCNVIQPVHHVLHECVVRCPILSSMYEHVPIYHRDVGIAIYRNRVVVSDTSSNLCIMCCMNVLQDIRLENQQSFNCTRYVLDCTSSRTLRTMTSHLRAYCNSGLKHFAVCLIAHSSVVDGRFPAVRLEVIKKFYCKHPRTSSTRTSHHRIRCNSR